MPSGDAPVEEQDHEGAQQRRLVPVGQLDVGEQPAGHVRGQAAHQLLVGVVRDGDVEGRLAQLDRGHEQEGQHDARAAAAATSCGEARTPANELTPVTLQIAAIIRMKNGSEASRTTSSRSAPVKL